MPIEKGKEAFSPTNTAFFPIIEFTTIFRGIKMGFRFSVLFLALLLLNCQEKVRKHNWFAMDSNMAVSIFGSAPISDDSIFFRLEAETERLSLLFSDFSSRSALSEIKGHIGDTVNVNPEIYTVLITALDVGEITHGSFDVTLHDLKWLWGLGDAQTGHIPDSASLDSLLKDNPTFHANWDSSKFVPPLTLLPGNRAILHRENTQIDLGAIAKGYIVDRLHALLDSLGCPNHILQAGGEIRVGGKKQSGPWKIGIRHPRASDSISGMIQTAEPKSISTSGDYERFFEVAGVRYHHIFDPRTGKPATPYCGVTIIAEHSILADAMSTSLFVLGPAKGMPVARHYHVSAVWFEARPSGLCLIPMPEILPLLDLQGTPTCTPP